MVRPTERGQMLVGGCPRDYSVIRDFWFMVLDGMGGRVVIWKEVKYWGGGRCKAVVVIIIDVDRSSILGTDLWTESQGKNYRH
jgi:hypothetical protein